MLKFPFPVFTDFVRKKLMKMMQLYVAPKRTSMDGDLYREEVLSRLIKITNLGSKFCFQNESLKETGVLKPEII